jgi:hypothetical protein
MSQYKPDDTVTHAVNSWPEYREIRGGEGQKLALRYVEKYYPRASRRGAIRAIYLPLVPYVEDMAAGAMDLPLRTTGPDAFKALIRKWRPALARTWKARLTCRASWVHFARRRGRLLLDMLYGDNLTIKADTEAPLEWDLVNSIEVPTADDGKIRYVRPDPDRPEVVEAETVNKSGDVTPLGSIDGWGTLPVFPCYRDDVDSLHPPCDRQLIDLHIAALLQLSDIEYRRVYRTSQMWRKSDGTEQGHRHGGGEMETGADTVAELSDTEEIGVAESNLKPAEDLAYVESFLRLAAQVLKFAPDLFSSGSASRAETGAAKSWDYRPLLAMQQQDREAADEWLAAFVEYIRPALIAEGIVSESDQLSVATVAPKLAEPASLIDYTSGVRAAMELGLTSPIREVARREGVGFSEAARLVNYNITQSRMVGIDAGAAKDKQPTPMEQSGTAKSTQVQ